MLPDWTYFFFFHVLPLLTPGGIINPPPKTACRDQAHFRRDSVKISTRLHFSVRVHFFPLYFSCFPFFSPFYSPDECTRTDIKLSIREQLAAQTPLPLFAQNFFFHSVLPASIHRWSRYSKQASPKLLYVAVLWNYRDNHDCTISVWSIVPMKCWQMKWNTWKGDILPFLFFVPFYLFFFLFFFFNNDEMLT